MIRDPRVLRDLSVLRVLSVLPPHRALQALPGRLVLRVQLLLFLALRVPQGLRGLLLRLPGLRVLPDQQDRQVQRVILGLLVRLVRPQLLLVQPGQLVLLVVRVQRGQLAQRVQPDQRGLTVLTGLLGRQVLLGLRDRRVLRVVLALLGQPGLLDRPDPRDPPGLLVLPRL